MWIIGIHRMLFAVRSTILLFHEHWRILGEYIMALVHLSKKKKGLALVYPSISYYYVMAATTMPFHWANLKSKSATLQVQPTKLVLLDCPCHYKLHLKMNPQKLNLKSSWYMFLLNQFLARAGTSFFQRKARVLRNFNRLLYLPLIE